MAMDEQNPEGRPVPEDGAADEQSTGRFRRIRRLAQVAREHRLLAALTGAAALATMFGIVRYEPAG